MVGLLPDLVGLGRVAESVLRSLGGPAFLRALSADAALPPASGVDLLLEWSWRSGSLFRPLLAIALCVRLPLCGPPWASVVCNLIRALPGPWAVLVGATFSFLAIEFVLVESGCRDILGAMFPASARAGRSGGDGSLIEVVGGFWRGCLVSTMSHRLLFIKSVTSRSHLTPICVKIHDVANQCRLPPTSACLMSSGDRRFFLPFF